MPHSLDRALSGLSRSPLACRSIVQYQSFVPSSVSLLFSSGRVRLLHKWLSPFTQSFTQSCTIQLYSMSLSYTIQTQTNKQNKTIGLSRRDEQRAVCAKAMVAVVHLHVAVGGSALALDEVAQPSDEERPTCGEATDQEELAGRRRRGRRP